MKIFGLKNCDKCCLAATVLDVANITDVKRIQIHDEILRRAFSKFGEKLVNRRSTTWRGLDHIEQQENPMELLKKYPTLMKRPLIKTQDGQLFWDGMMR